jgi:hypothetical protein
VIKRVGPVAVKLELPLGYNIHPVFHVSLVKHYKASEHSPPPPPIMELDEDGLPVYVVECIMGHRQKTVNRQRTWEFLVKWVGMGPERNSWEPLKHFSHPRLMIKEYWDSLGGEPLLTRSPTSGHDQPTTVRGTTAVRQSARLAASVRNTRLQSMPITCYH